MAVRFTGAGQYWYSTAGMPVSRTFTVLCWAYLDGALSGTNGIIWTLDGSSATQLWVGATGGTLYHDWPGSGSTSITGATFSTGTWYATAFTANGNTATLWQGTSASALTSYTSGASLALPAGSLTLKIGESQLGTSWWNGRVANFKYFDSVLVRKEIEQELAYYYPRVGTDQLTRWHPFIKSEATEYVATLQNRALSGGTGSSTAAGPPIPWRGARMLNVPIDPATQIIYAVYLVSDGTLLSLGPGDPNPLDPSMAYKMYYGAEVDGSRYIWDPTVIDFVLREGIPTLDRVADIVADASCSAAWATLSSPNSLAIQNRIGQLLGPYRYRYSWEPIDLEEKY